MANAHDMSSELIQFFGIMPVCLHYEKYQSSLCIQYRPKFKQLKDRNLLKKHTKNQEATLKYQIKVHVQSINFGVYFRPVWPYSILYVHYFLTSTR